MPDTDQGAGKIVKLEMECRLNAPVEKVFAAMTTELDEWWAFRFNDASKVVLEPWVGGRVFEDWGDGRGALYGHVCYYDPPYKLGTRGPGGIDGNYANINWEIFQRDGEGTLYRKSFRLWGEVPEEAEQMYTQGMKAIMEQLLRDYVEHGKGRRRP